MKRACRNCKFFADFNPANTVAGSCLRNPPQLVGGGNASAMPAVLKVNICGEHKRRRWWHWMPKQLAEIQQQEGRP